ncbi:cell wall hydrolase [Blautia sp. MSJ-19]|uniref:cell wall hydrolase n=1 Tax=Blautia sp. MSJ-19 TaxID=2841517 RepID=UPI001C0EE25B|nr:cell wall hydrolase [Blautia sp. MSJ-19]MBU5481786.1 cell wall hydrolase [Blautia sp. MSJ-19]
MKVYAVDAAMILLAAQVTVVLKADNKAEASTYTAIQTVQDEYTETVSDTEVSENDTEDIFISESVQSWNNKDSDILLRIAMAEAEGEGTEGKALVMKVVLNRVASREFPNSVEDVVFQSGQFEPVLDDGRYWNVEPDAECYKALYMVQCENWDDTEGALYFSRTGSSPWMENNTEYLFTMGNHSFYR